MYETILVPTDGSRGSSVAADHALDLAEAHGASVHAVNVVSPVHTDGLARPDEAVEGLREYGEELVTRIATRAGKRELDCRTAVVEGAPNEAILAYAEDNDADLIVMGTHGRTGLQRYLLGSVTERVVRSATVPVLTLSPETAPEVNDAETAVEFARDALAHEGHGDIEVDDSPSRQASTWVVRAETDRGSFNVHVGTDGQTHVAGIPES